MWPSRHYVAGMDWVRQQLHRPAVWLIPLVVLAIQLGGSAGPRHRRGMDLHWVPLNWFGYLLLVAGPVVLLLRTVYPYAVLLTVIAITGVYLSAGFRFGPVFASLIVAFLTAATVGPRWRTYPLPVLGWLGVVWLIPFVRGEDPPPAIAIGAIAADPALTAVRVVVLTTFELDEYVFEAMRAGASGFLVKHTEPAELVRAVRVVADGEALLSPSVTRRLVSEFAARTKQPAGPSAALAELTLREREVMALVAEGLTNAEIGERLFMSPATARTHVSRILTKLGARDRTQLVVMAYESGLVRPGWRD
jgi:DNA-binding NarL/FixJ family response regulator